MPRAWTMHDDARTPYFKYMYSYLYRTFTDLTCTVSLRYWPSKTICFYLRTLQMGLNDAPWDWIQWFLDISTRESNLTNMSEISQRQSLCCVYSCTKIKPLCAGMSGPQNFSWKNSHRKIVIKNKLDCLYELNLASSFLDYSFFCVNFSLKILLKNNSMPQ